MAPETSPASLVFLSNAAEIPAISRLCQLRIPAEPDKLIFVLRKWNAVLSQYKLKSLNVPKIESEFLPHRTDDFHGLALRFLLN